MSLWLIYFLVMIPAIKTTIGTGLSPVGITLVILSIALTVLMLSRGLLKYLNGPDKEPDEAVTEKISVAWKYIRKAAYVYAAAVVLFVVLPSSNQLIAIAGISMVTNIEGVSNLPENIVKAMNTGLEELSSMSVEAGEPAAPAAPVK